MEKSLALQERENFLKKLFEEEVNYEVSRSEIEIVYV